MKKLLLSTLAALFAMATPALAHHEKHHRWDRPEHRFQRDHERHYRGRRHHFRGPIHNGYSQAPDYSAPQQAYGQGGTLLSRMESAIGATAYQLGVRPTLWCAAILNKFLHGGTHSDEAFSYLHYGRSTYPHPGAVAVMGRRGGGHVAVVERVTGGRVEMISGNYAGRVARESRPINSIISFRDI